MTVDLNADVGEGADDEALLPFITSVNVACGRHAGDADTAGRTIRAARDAGLAIGAHPSYPDRERFGRASVKMPRAALADVVAEQIAWLRDLAHSEAVEIRHVKPHGALYNDAARDAEIADAIVEAVRRVDAALLIVGLAGSSAMAHYRSSGLFAVAEAFCDRAYEADGSLRDRRLPGALLSEPQDAARQAVAIVRDGATQAHSGGVVRIAARTLCIHSDTPNAAAIARAVRAAVLDAGAVLAPAERDA